MIGVATIAMGQCLGPICVSLLAVGEGHFGAALIAAAMLLTTIAAALPGGLRDSSSSQLRAIVLKLLVEVGDSRDPTGRRQLKTRFQLVEVRM